MRRLIVVGLCALILAVMLPCVPGLHVLGPADAFAYGEDGMAVEQDSGGGSGGPGGVSVGDPDGPQASPKGTSWRYQRGGTWRGANVYGRANVSAKIWSLRDLIMGLRLYYLRF
jgi:hypothetical protein